MHITRIITRIVVTALTALLAAPLAIGLAAPAGAADGAERHERRAHQQAWEYITTSRAANDPTGVRASAYTGRYFRSSQESVRSCIFRRESGADYRSTNRSGGYFGGYQMTRALAVGASWMLLKEHKELIGAKRARHTLARLRATPMHQWSRYWQDAAFYTVYNWEHNGSGAKHWAGGRWHC